jgi:hypothetical protein
MKPLSVREAKCNLGRLIDAVRAALVVIEKHCRLVVVALSSVAGVRSIEEYERLKVIDRRKAAA